MRVEISKEIDVILSVKFKQTGKAAVSYKPEFVLLCEDTENGEEKTITLTPKQVESIIDDTVSINDMGTIEFDLNPEDNYISEKTVYWNEDAVREIVEEAYGVG